ncbi:helix-turn-helix domain-containing protein [Dysosmobacter sp.]|uniref:helix-turn-helix domain-containing protein n=1 Tax=Dysosmobacter sp. TaxID=2591382 RepID=UPI002A8DDC81|nr:helix-turn-helix domain-containing protein [Dysosmobacter sp.]MDY3281812.1 helix-turn-helix domain-containing protein [Dysosmobacter sp.]
MGQYVTGSVIRALREKRNYTQKQLAEAISVSDKTVSKWETDRGLPDVTLLEPLAKALQVSVAELLSGEYVVNRNRSGNPERARFYICPICGNVIWSMGEGAFSCCGVALPPLEPEEPDGEHALTVEVLDNEWYVSADHPMTKDHYFSFIALVSYDRVQLCKLYPEQAAEARFPRRGGGTLYACCNRHGLYRLKLKR